MQPSSCQTASRSGMRAVSLKKTRWSPWWRNATGGRPPRVAPGLLAPTASPGRGRMTANVVDRRIPWPPRMFRRINWAAGSDFPKRQPPGPHGSLFVGGGALSLYMATILQTCRLSQPIQVGDRFEDAPRMSDRGRLCEFAKPAWKPVTAALPSYRLDSAYDFEDQNPPDAKRPVQVIANTTLQPVSGLGMHMLMNR